MNYAASQQYICATDVSETDDAELCIRSNPAMFEVGSSGLAAGTVSSAATASQAMLTAKTVLAGPESS